MYDLAICFGGLPTVHLPRAKVPTLDPPFAVRHDDGVLRELNHVFELMQLLVTAPKFAHIPEDEDRAHPSAPRSQ